MWKDITETNNKYSISEQGLVKNNKTGRLMKYFISTKGYKKVSLDYKQYTIHRLIALYYIPNPDNKPYINHINGNKLDNSISNLEWCTNKENKHHASINNLMGNRRTLTPDQAKYIKYNRNIPAKDLANQFNISKITIYKIWDNSMWRNI